MIVRHWRNQIRGLLAEYGIVVHKGISTVRRELPLILEDEEWAEYTNTGIIR